MTDYIFDRSGEKIDLDSIPTTPPKKLSREDAEARLRELEGELTELQELMWGAKTHGVLVVLQGRDSAGKDGVIKRVVGALNPRGVSAVSFGVPTAEELSHDFLWRVHRHAPAHGEFSIFNRSHYEDVLVVKVHNLVPKELVKERYGHIHDFEELLAEHNTIVLKFFLHISKDEQHERLVERENDPVKAWKINAGDWKERNYWKQYTAAYEEAMSRCASKLAPWQVVPADAKWYRNLVVAESIVAALRPHRKTWESALAGKAKVGKKELQHFRSTPKKS